MSKWSRKCPYCWAEIWSDKRLEAHMLKCKIKDRTGKSSIKAPLPERDLKGRADG